MERMMARGKPVYMKCARCRKLTQNSVLAPSRRVLDVRPMIRVPLCEDCWVDNPPMEKEVLIGELLGRRLYNAAGQPVD